MENEPPSSEFTYPTACCVGTNADEVAVRPRRRIAESFMIIRLCLRDRMMISKMPSCCRCKKRYEVRRRFLTLICVSLDNFWRGPAIFVVSHGQIVQGVLVRLICWPGSNLS